MLESDEIFEIAQETGYRLCSTEPKAAPVEGRKIFSVSWDTCVPRRLFVCATSGELEVHDMNQGTVDRYHIEFRRFVAAHESAAPGEVKAYHWDRMATVPSRPGELFFLLGVSDALYYTALPKNTFAALPPFLRGAEVMEIHKHSGRITSLAVSPGGHFLASGDEHGNVRILQLLSDSAKRIRYPNPSVELTACRRLHEHSAIALAFVPGAAGALLLASGSEDSAVRLWKVSCTPSGVDLLPHLSLRTLPPCSTVLSLAVQPCPGGALLAAGTLTGTVLVWKLPSASITTSVEQQKEVEGELVNIIEASPAGIVLLSMCSSSSSGPLMVMSDLQGTVRVYGWASRRQLSWGEDPLQLQLGSPLTAKHAQALQKHAVNQLLEQGDEQEVEGFVPLRAEARGEVMVTAAFSPSAEHLLVASHAGQLMVYAMDNVLDAYAPHTSSPLRNLYEGDGSLSSNHSNHNESPSLTLPSHSPSLLPTPLSISPPSRPHHHPMMHEAMSPAKQLFAQQMEHQEDEEEEEEEEVPRQLPSPYMQQQHSPIPPPPPVPAAAVRTGRAAQRAMDDALEKSTDSTAWPRPAPPSPIPMPIPGPVAASAPASAPPRRRDDKVTAVKEGRVASRMTMQAPPAPTPPTAAISASARTVSPAAASVPAPVQEDDDDVLPPREPSPYALAGDMLHPALHSSKRVQAEAEQLTNRLLADEEEASLSTTSSDRRYAQKATAAAMQRRYTALPAVQQDVISDAGSSHKRGTKTIVPRERTILSPEEVDALHVPAPHVALSIAFAPSSANKVRYNQRYGLHATLSEDRQLPVYSLELQGADLFGDIMSRAHFQEAEGAQVMEDFMMDRVLGGPSSYVG